MEQSQKVLSKIKDSQGYYIIPPSTFIIIERIKQTTSGLILPDNATSNLGRGEEVVAIGQFVNNVKVGDRAVVSFAKYIREVPGNHDLGKDFINAFPEERVLNINGRTYYLMHESDVMYTLSTSNTL